MGKILLIDADSTIPNIALGKLSTYHKQRGDKVDFIQLNIPYYPTKKHVHHVINTRDYDKTYCSVVFNNSINYVQGDVIEFGGSGYSLDTWLPPNIEGMKVDYSLYPDNDTSYGFITRGCIRNCYFCVVPKKEGMIHQVANVDDIVHHKKVKFLDNNILSFIEHKKILQELVDKNIKCQFNQGLDIRLVDEENSELLRQLNYIGEYIFAFDDWKCLSQIERGMRLLTWAKDWQLKFFVYVQPDMELANIVNRMEWLRRHNQLPYVMRNISCWESEYNELYVDLAAWGNQPGIFKNMTFQEFLMRRHPKNIDRVNKHIRLYKEDTIG